MPGGTLCQFDEGFVHLCSCLTATACACTSPEMELGGFPCFCCPACLCHLTTESSNTCKSAGSLQLSKVTVASNPRLLWLLMWIVLVEGVVLRYLKKGLGIVRTNILRALQYLFSLTKVGVSITGLSVSRCSLGLFYPELKELVLKQVSLKRCHSILPSIDTDCTWWVLPSVWLITYGRDLDERENLELSSFSYIKLWDNRWIK